MQAFMSIEKPGATPDTTSGFLILRFCLETPALNPGLQGLCTGS